MNGATALAGPVDSASSREVPLYSRNPIRTVREFRHDIVAATESGWQKYGGLVRYSLGPVSVYVVSDAELAHEVFTDTAVYGKLGPDNPLRLVLGTGLLTTSDHVVWRRNRRMMQPMYSRTSIEQMYATMWSCVSRMLDQVERDSMPGDIVDMHRIQMSVTLDVVSQCMLGLSLGDLGDAAEPDAVEYALNFAFDRLQNPLSAPLRWPTPTNRRFRRVMRQFDSVVYRLIADRRHGSTPERHAGEAADDDLLGMLLRARDEATGAVLDAREIRDEVITTFAAGHESTAQTLTWAMYLLSQHPRAAAQVREEVDAVLGGRAPTAADLGKLKYTSQVAAEALRLYPSAPLIPRLVAEDCTLGGYRIPAGSRLLVSLYNIGRDPRHWDDPAEFRPERFDGDKPIGVGHKSFAPFGAGPHLCIGKRFATAESLMILAGLFQRFEFRHNPHHRVRQLASITLRPKYGMEIIYRPRTERLVGGAGRAVTV